MTHDRKSDLAKQNALLLIERARLASELDRERTARRRIESYLTVMSPVRRPWWRRLFAGATQPLNKGE